MRPKRCSLRLLPSGPDRVGEALARPTSQFHYMSFKALIQDLRRNLIASNQNYSINVNKILVEILFTLLMHLIMNGEHGGNNLN